MAKRVVAFVDLIDLIPDSAIYLYSSVRSYPVEKTEDQRTRQIISGEIAEEMAQVVMHYYEVRDVDFDNPDFIALLPISYYEKIKIFNQKYLNTIKTT